MAGQKETSRLLRQLHADLIACAEGLRYPARLQKSVGTANLHIAAEHIDRAVEAIHCRIEEVGPPN